MGQESLLNTGTPPDSLGPPRDKEEPLPGNSIHSARSEHYRHMTSREEIAKPARLRTYVDDWRLFKAGNHRAATTLVESLVTTCQALEEKGMK
eukprot:12342958-Heterocapsa_arctica.AAC.1